MISTDFDAYDEAVSECPSHSMIVAPHCLPICDLRRDQSYDVVLGPRLDEMKEEVTEEQPSSRWMRVAQAVKGDEEFFLVTASVSDQY